MSATTHLFVDDVRIERKEGVVRRTHACSKLAEPVISGRESWQSPSDDERVYIYGTVLPSDDGEGYRMWYMRYPDQLLYAESDDGIHWRRPDLGLVDIKGSIPNNLLPTSYHSPSLVCDCREPDPALRYKMLGVSRDPDRRGYSVATSSDGIRWTPSDANPVLTGGDTCALAQDPVTGQFLAFHKRYHEHRGQERRLVYLSTSDDFHDWSEPVLAMAPDDVDDAQTAAEGGCFSQFYNTAAFPCGDMWLGLVTHFRYSGAPPESGPDQSRHDGPIDVQLTCSRDGRTWSRLEDRSPVIPNGPHDYDAGGILGVANAPVDAGDETWVYYTAITTTHGGCTPRKKITIARAAWRRHGWVSLDADASGGTVETKPVLADGQRLSVNTNALNGELRAEILDTEGNPIPGYGLEACLPIDGDGVRQVV
ncbi:MAG: hypothetical protein HN396_18850, partial [Gemmatimonadales bacterium]|nr:hypothetical protein [Gemmatimonadales bacterium]